MTIGALALVLAAAGAVAGFSSLRLADGTPTFNRWVVVKSSNGNADAASNEPLPSGVTIDNISGVTKVQFTCAAASPPAKSTKNNVGATLEYRATTDDAVNTTKNFSFRVLRKPTASAVAAIYASTGASSSSYASILGVSQSATGVLGGDEQDAVQGPALAILFKGQSKVESDAGNYYPFPFTIDGFATSASASGGVGGNPGQPRPPLKAYAAAAATVDLLSTASSKTSLSTDEIVRTGSAFRPNTYFQVTRSDTSATTIDTCARNEEGGAGYFGLGYPNTTLTIKLVQPGFLQQTMTRDVYNEEFVAVGTTGPIVPISIALTFGDANGDNAITSADIAIINGYVGMTESSPDWFDDVPNSAIIGGWLRCRICDLDENQDGAITSADVAVATANLPSP